MFVSGREWAVAGSDVVEAGRRFKRVAGGRGRLESKSRRIDSEWLGVCDVSFPLRMC
jgi:hypothetical protein